MTMNVILMQLALIFMVDISVVVMMATGVMVEFVLVSNLIVLIIAYS